MREVVDQGGAEGFFEEPHRVVRVQPHLAADFRRGELLRVATGDEAGHLLDLAQRSAVQAAGASTARAGRRARLGQGADHAAQPRLHLEHHHPAHFVAGVREILLPLREELLVVTQAAGAEFLADHLALQQTLHEEIRQLALEKPREGNRGHEVADARGKFQNLMRYRRPEYTELAALDAHLLTSEQVGHPALGQDVHLDLVVVIGALHRRGRPAHAREAVGSEIRAIRIEGDHGGYLGYRK